MSKVQDIAKKLGYSQEESYFHEVNQKLIDNLRKERKTATPTSPESTEEAPLAKIILFPQRDNTPKMKAA